MNERLRQKKLFKWGKRLLLFCGLSALAPGSAEAQTYCSLTYSSGCSGGHGVSNVVIGSFTHSPACNTTNYTSQNIPITAGVPTSGSATVNGYCGVGLAADFNNDGDFEDAGESLALPNYFDGPGGVANYTFTISVPSNVPTGNYRLRVWTRLANGGGVNNGVLPCGTYNYGRYADYTLAVTNATNCYAPSGVTATATPSGATIGWTASTSTPANYRWAVMTTTGVPGTDPPVATGVTSGTSDVVTGLTPLTSYKLYVKSLCSANDSSIWTLAYTLNTPCDGTPSGGTTNASVTTVCAGVNFDLSLAGNSNGTGITYQWQSSPMGANTFANISGATSATYSATQSAATDYRCVVKCTTTNLTAESSPVTVLQSPGTSCYCTPTVSNTAYYITSFSTTGGATNITNNGTGSGAYNNYSATMSASALMGNTVNFSLTGNNASESRAIYIDWNQNGLFTDAGELVYSNNSTASATVTGSFTVPFNALAGNTRMRVRTTYYSGYTMAPCGLIFYGETEDYTFNVIPVTGVCVIPVNLTASAVTQTGATITFNAPPAGNTPTSFIYELRVDGTAAGSGATGLVANNNTTSTTLNFTTLAPATNYQLFARTFCSAGDTSAWTSVSFSTSFDTLTTVPLGGFNADVVANGVGAANLSTNNDVDGASWALVSNDFRASASVTTAPANSIPANRIVRNGLRKYYLNNYKLNNSLRMPATSTGTIRFLAPKQANKLYIMGVSGSGVSTNNMTIYFRDGSTQTATNGFPDWYGDANNVMVGAGRINRNNNTLEVGPRLHDSAVVILTANRTKQIDSIRFNHTGNVMNVLAVSVVPNKDQACPLPAAIGAVTAITSGGATLAWTGNGTNTNYQVSYGYEGTHADLGTIVSVSGTAGANSQAVSGLDPATDYQIFVRTNCGGGSYSDWIGPMYFTTLSSNCTGTPAVTTVTSTTTSVCPNVPYTLNVSNVSSANGITLKWQSSPSGMGTWTTLSTVTPVIGTSTYTYIASGQSAATDYRCVVSCSFSGDSSVSNTYTVAQNPFNTCYCIPTYVNGCSNGARINNFSTTGAIDNITNNNTGCAISGGYSNYTAQFVRAVKGTTVNFSLTGQSYSGGAVIWVDWNHDGLFSASESMYASASTITAGSTVTGSFVVPVTALSDTTRMRVRMVEGSTNFDPCASYSYGETEDYTFIAVAQTACTGVPAPGNTNATAVDLCVSGNSTFTLQNNYVTSSGITYQWQSSPDGTVWTNIAGANSHTYTASGITATTKFRARLICNAGPDTGYSSPATVTVHALPSVSVTPNTAAFCTTGSATLVATGASTYSWTPSTGLSINTGASVDAAPSSFTTYTVTGTDAFGCVNTATATVGPMAAITPVTAYQNVCAPGTTTSIVVSPIATVGGSMEYQLTDATGTVVANWQSGNTFDVTPASQGLNQYFVFARNGSCPTAVSDTATVNIYAGFGASVLTTDATCANGNGSLLVSLPYGPGIPGGGLIWYSNDFSSATMDTTRAALRGVATVTGGVLRLTPNSGSQNGGLVIKNPAAISGNVDSVKFILSVPQNGADGISWSFGDGDYPSDLTNYALESGVGNKLIISFDAYGSGSPGAAGIYLTYGMQGGAAISTTVSATMLGYSSNVSWRQASNTPVGIYITTDGKLTLKVGSTTVFNNVQLPAAYVNANRSTWKQVFAARTGGVSEEHSIDNLNIYYSGNTYVYGSSPAHSNAVPSTWQSANTFAGLSGGDSLDLWVANPANPATCHQKIGTYGVSAPVVARPYLSDNPSCVGTDDGYIVLAVNAQGTYDVTYTKNGGTPYTLSGVVSGNDGTNEYVLMLLPEGTYTNMKVTNSGGCVSNTVGGPVTLVAPDATAIAGGTSSGTLPQPGAGTQYYTDGSCNLIAGVTSSLNLGTVTASVTVGSPLVSASNSEPFLGRYYEITPTANGSAAATVKLYFSQDDFDDYNAAPEVGSTYPAILPNGSNLRITAFHGNPAGGTTGPNGSYDASNSDLLQPSSVVWNATGNWWEVTVSSPNGFSGFFANTNTGTPLQLTIGDISATNTGSANRVDWTTKTEALGDRFQVESSSDGRSFRAIGNVSAKGAAPGRYSFVDQKPYSGVTYYRVLMTDADGRRQYSNIVHATMKGGGFGFSVYPNPVNSEVTVKVTSVTGKGMVEVSDVTGRTIAVKQVNADGVVKLSMENLASGVYLIRYQDDVHSQAMKVNKN